MMGQRNAVLAGTIAFTVAAVGYLVAAIHFSLPGGGYGKMAASTGFLATALAAGALQGWYGRTLLVGLVLSWWGDLFLLGSGDMNFLLGLVSFLLAHVAYSTAFLVAGVRPVWLAGGALAVAAVSIPIARWLFPHVGEMFYPVLSYTLVISAMLALALGTLGRSRSWWLVAGALLFYISDIFVARQRFVTPSAWNAAIGLPVYFSAQLMLAYSIAAARKPAEREYAAAIE